jgi:hypothetical protein
VHGVVKADNASAVEIHEVKPKILFPWHIQSHDESSRSKEGHILFRDVVKDELDVFGYGMYPEVIHMWMVILSASAVVKLSNDCISKAGPV